MDSDDDNDFSFPPIPISNQLTLNVNAVNFIRETTHNIVFTPQQSVRSFKSK